jgi:hypothetical protein
LPDFLKLVPDVMQGVTYFVRVMFGVPLEEVGSLIIEDIFIAYPQVLLPCDEILAHKLHLLRSPPQQLLLLVHLPWGVVNVIGGAGVIDRGALIEGVFLCFGELYLLTDHAILFF